MFNIAKYSIKLQQLNISNTETFITKIYYICKKCKKAHQNLHQLFVCRKFFIFVNVIKRINICFDPLIRVLINIKCKTKLHK